MIVGLVMDDTKSSEDLSFGKEIFFIVGSIDIVLFVVFLGVRESLRRTFMASYQVLSCILHFIPVDEYDPFYKVLNLKHHFIAPFLLKTWPVFVFIAMFIVTLFCAFCGGARRESGVGLGGGSGGGNSQ